MKRFIILLSFAVITLVLILVFFVKQPITQLPSPLPTPTPVLPVRAINIIPTFSPFQKTTINETTEQQVKQLPNVVASGSALGDNIYTIPSVNPLIPNEIRTKNGVVIFERTSTYTSDPGGFPSLKSEMDKLGMPEQVINGNVTYGPPASSFLYPKKGIVLIGNEFTDETYEIQQFAPTTLLDYLRKYGNIVQSEEPQDQFQL